MQSVTSGSSLQAAAWYSVKKANPKEQKKQQKQQQKASKKKASQAAQDASAGQDGEGTSYYDDQKAVDQDALRIVLRAIDNITPLLDVRTEKVATKVIFVPGLMPPK